MPGRAAGAVLSLLMTTGVVGPGPGLGGRDKPDQPGPPGPQAAGANATVAPTVFCPFQCGATARRPCSPLRTWSLRARPRGRGAITTRGAGSRRGHRLVEVLAGARPNKACSKVFCTPSLDKSIQSSKIFLKKICIKKDLTQIV